MPRDITARQAEIFAFIQTYIKEHAIPPTVREIAQAFGFKPAAARAVLAALEKKGYIQRIYGTARGIVILYGETSEDKDLRMLATAERFLTEHCIYDRLGAVTPKAIYAAYSDWCEKQEHTPISTKAFATRLEKARFECRHKEIVGPVFCIRLLYNQD